MLILEIRLSIPPHTRNYRQFGSSDSIAQEFMYDFNLKLLGTGSNLISQILLFTDRINGYSSFPMRNETSSGSETFPSFYDKTNSFPTLDILLPVLNPFKPESNNSFNDSSSN